MPLHGSCGDMLLMELSPVGQCNIESTGVRYAASGDCVGATGWVAGQFRTDYGRTSSDKTFCRNWFCCLNWLKSIGIRAQLAAWHALTPEWHRPYTAIPLFSWRNIGLHRCCCCCCSLLLNDVIVTCAWRQQWNVNHRRIPATVQSALEHITVQCTR